MTTNNSNTRKLLFSDFPSPTYEAWFEATIASLKGVPFNKLVRDTVEGITVYPLYRQEDVAEIVHMHTLPGQSPFLRGTTHLGYKDKPWGVAQAISLGLPLAFNHALKADLARGLTAVIFLLDPPTRAGHDPDQAEVGQVGYRGVSIATAADFATALEHVDINHIPLIIQAGSTPLPLTALLVAARQNGAVFQGAIENDPIAYLFENGRFPTSLETAYDETATLTQWAAEHAPKLRTIGLVGTVYHEGGASAVQELAFTMATAVSSIRALLTRGLDINTIARHIHFTFSLGGHFFMEVAKLRAARLLWSKIVVAFGGDEEAQKLHCHVTTAQHNKTITDAHVNMLRVTTEAFSGAVGGADSINVAPFDDIVRPSDEFSRRIARNVQLILQAEAKLTSLVDPAGGSWYIEYLTDQIAENAWTLLQVVEGAGGMTAVSQTTYCQEQLDRTSHKRRTSFYTRKDILVGTNMYANLTEELLTDPTDYEAIFEQRIKTINDLRITDFGSQITDMQTAVSAAKSGATLNQITAALRKGTTTAVTTTPITPYHPAADILKLRTAANAYTERNGHPPHIFLANIGSLPDHKPRSDFTTGFFEVGGFEMVLSDGFTEVETAVATALAAKTEAVAICGTDAAYPDFVPAFAQQIKAANPAITIILAGYPKAHIDTFKAVGVDLFIYLGANCYELNKELQQKIASSFSAKE